MPCRRLFSPFFSLFTNGRVLNYVKTEFPNEPLQVAQMWARRSVVALFDGAGRELLACLFGRFRFLFPAFAFLPISLLAFLIFHHLFDRSDVVGSILFETLKIQLLNKLWQWKFPWLLFVVCLATKPLRIHAKLFGHLNVSMRKMKSLPCINPYLALRRELFLLFSHGVLLKAKIELRRFNIKTSQKRSMLLRTWDACQLTMDLFRSCFHYALSAKLTFHGVHDSGVFRLINLHFLQ